MNEILKELEELCNAYKKISNNLCPDDNLEEYYEDCDEAFEKGRGQAYWEVHNDLQKLMKKYK